MYLPNILPYTDKVYQSLYEDEFITSFTHSNLAKGQTDLAKAAKFVDRLNVGSKCITFNQAMLKGDQLSGGACSAIAFRVAKEALLLLRSLNLELTPSNREKSFASQLSRFVQIQEQIATGSAAEEKREQLEFRTEQMALNTITVDRDVIKSGNAVAQKISAMAPFYGLKVVESSSELRVRGNDQLEAQLSKQTGKLKEGVYFLRIIIEENNHKREQQGHSIVYIKTGQAEYYFDPTLGYYHLFPEATKTNLIYNALLSANQKFGVDVLSFHRLEEENPISATCNPNGIIYTPCHALETRPVVIFSPALGESLSAYKNMAQGLCSKGFIVMCLDHPGTGIGTPMLEDPEIIARGLQNGSHIAKMAERIRSGEFANIPRDAPIGVLGHSLGGSSSVEACRRTAEIGAAINLDGRIIEPTDISQPVLQLIAKRVKEDRSKYHAALEALAQTNPLLTRKEVEAKHGDFCSSYPGFLNFTIDECEVFFKKHLLNGAKK